MREDEFAYDISKYEIHLRPDYSIFLRVDEIGIVHQR